MLYEINGVEQHRGEHRRRWFFDHDLDLCVWIGELGQIIGFQLVYDKSSDTHALTWWENRGYHHNRVIDDRWHLPNTLVADGLFEHDRIASMFRAMAADIDPEVSAFVFGKLLEYKG